MAKNSTFVKFRVLQDEQLETGPGIRNTLIILLDSCNIYDPGKLDFMTKSAHPWKESMYFPTLLSYNIHYLPWKLLSRSIVVKLSLSTALCLFPPVNGQATTVFMGRIRFRHGSWCPWSLVVPQPESSRRYRDLTKSMLVQVFSQAQSILKALDRFGKFL